MRRKPRCSLPVEPEGMTTDASRRFAAGRAERTTHGEALRPVAGAIRRKGFGASRNLIAGWAGGSKDGRKPEFRSPAAGKIDSWRKLGMDRGRCGRTQDEIELRNDHDMRAPGASVPGVFVCSEHSSFTSSPCNFR